MVTNKNAALEAFQSQTTEAFRNSLHQQVTQQDAPFAVFCLYVHYLSAKGEKKNKPAKILSNWHRVVISAIANGTDAEKSLIVDTDNHIGVVVSDCSFELCGQIARLIRTRLMQDFPSLRLSIGVSQVSSENVDVETLLAELCGQLGVKIEARSSSIDIKRY